MGRRSRKVWLIVGGVVLLAIIAATLYYFSYDIKFNIKRSSVAYARIIYYGDGFEKEVEDNKNLDMLINALNKVNLRKYWDMSYLFPKSGVLVIVKKSL